MSEIGMWFGENWVAVLAVVAGIVICTGAGLLALVPDPEQPLRFLPVYAVSMSLFLFGLVLIAWCESVEEYIGDIREAVGL